MTKNALFRPRQRSAAVMALGLSALLALAACSSSKSGSGGNGSAGAPTTGSTASAAPTSPAPTGTPLVIGTIENQTGGAQTGKTTEGNDLLTAWAKYTNTHGGIAGHPVKLIAMNDNSDPAQSKSDLKQLVEQDKVLAIVGQDAGTTEQTWVPYIDAQKVPVIGGIGYTSEWYSDPNFYPSSTTILPLLWGRAYTAKLAGKTKMANLTCTGMAVCNFVQPLYAKAATLNGLENVYNGSGASAAPDFTAQCLAMKSAGADTVVVNTTLLTFVNSCSRQHYSPLIVYGNYQIPVSQIQSVPQFVGLKGISSAFPVFQEFPASKTYFDILRAYAPQWLPGSSTFNNGRNLQALSVNYIAALAFAKAIENLNLPATHVVTRADVVQGLSKIQNETFGGLAPPLSFGNGKTPSKQPVCFFDYTTIKGNPGYVTSPPNSLKQYCMPTNLAAPFNVN